MKKTILSIVLVLLIIALGVGIYFGISSSRKRSLFLYYEGQAIEEDLTLVCGNKYEYEVKDMFKLDAKDIKVSVVSSNLHNFIYYSGEKRFIFYDLDFSKLFNIEISENNFSIEIEQDFNFEKLLKTYYSDESIILSEQLAYSTLPLLSLVVQSGDSEFRTNIVIGYLVQDVYFEDARLVF